jgi:hypothetical protein
MSSIRISREAVHLLLIFVVTLTTYVMTMPRTISFEDAGMFQMVCHMGGISHPPGYPLFTSLCQLFVALPVFSPGVFAGNFLSAIFAALACVVFFSCCMAITRDKFLSYIAALGYGLSATFWSQAIIIEVYSLAVLMFVLCFRVLLLYTDSGKIHHLYVAIAIYALALTNHWPLMVLSTPALLAVISTRTKLIMAYLKSPFFWGVSILLCLIGLSPYLTLFFQQESSIAVFGPVNSVPEFMKYLSRSVYSDNHEIAGVMDRGRYALWLLRESSFQFGWLGVPVILLGLLESFRSRPLSINISFVLVYVSGTFLLNLLLNFRYDFYWQAIFKPYPVISYLALAFWFAVGVKASADWVGRRVESKGRVLPVVISVCVLVGLLSINFERNNRANSTWVDQYGRVVLESLPLNSVFFLRGDFEFGLFGYLHHVMEVRPDIELRSWDNLVFSNRLVSPHDSYEVQQRKRTEFLERESRPVFTISAGLSPVTQLGGYNQYNPGQLKNVERNPEMDAFLDYFLDLYLGGYITDPHEIYFAFYRLVNFTRQYVGLALTHEGLSEVELRRLERLQLTFPGKLATLETLVGADFGVAGKEVLLDFADAAEDQIPEFITNESLAVFYEFYGRAHAMEPSDKNQAIKYFEMSVQELPIQTNTSLCPLIRLYQSESNQSELNFILVHYPDLECQ